MILSGRKLAGLIPTRQVFEKTLSVCVVSQRRQVPSRRRCTSVRRMRTQRFSRDGDAARLVFARAPDAPGDMNALMRKACEMIEGRGGGKADMAQGGGKKVSAIDDALAAATKLVTER